MNERPACHRAEDLVTYLYGEASAADAADFRSHLQQCEACRNEFGVFNQVHDSIAMWRNEALGASFTPQAIAPDTSNEFIHSARPERKLTALAAVREFFNVAPLWLRGTTAFAGLLLCALMVLAIARSWQQPAPMIAITAEPKLFTQADLDKAVAEAKLQATLVQTTSLPPVNESVTPKHTSPQPEIASDRNTGKGRAKRLTRQEEQQLAADLRLIPGADDEELPFMISEEPNQ